MAGLSNVFADFLCGHQNKGSLVED